MKKLFISTLLVIFSKFSFCQNAEKSLKLLAVISKDTTFKSAEYVVPANRVWKIENIFVTTNSVTAVNGKVIINFVNGVAVYTSYNPAKAIWLNSGNKISFGCTNPNNADASICFTAFEFVVE